MNRGRSIGGMRRLPLVAAILAGLYAPVAFSQDTPPATDAQAAQQQEEQEQEAQPATGEVTQLGKITVTGSLLRRDEYESTSPVQVITADTSIALGQVAASEFLQKSSVAAGSTQISNMFSGFVVEGGTGVQTLSLRGLGANRTLVLLDGQRPGPAGTRGQVGAFDLNVIPQVILQRAEIVKDGSSSIYGSDAVAGVVNLITRTNLDEPEVQISARTPLDGGGETYTVSGATGWNWGNASVVAAAEYFLHEPLRIGDRNYLRCAQDLVWDAPGGNRIDRQDRSVIADTIGNCSAGNLYANTVIDAVTGLRYIPSPDGVTIGLIPGYRPRTNGTYATGQAYYEDVLNFPFFEDQQVIDRQERFSAYASALMSFDNNVNWQTQFLYNKRETDAHRWRQFFPLVGGSTAIIPVYAYPNSPDFAAPVPSGIAQPVMPFPSDARVEVDYYFLNTKLDGFLGFTDTWSWQFNAGYTRSSGDYSALSIVGSKSGDRTYSDTAPTVDYFDPGFLSGERMDELVNAVGQWHTGNTVYEQTVLQGIVTGDLFEMPAGAAAAAFGLEYRDYSIDDQPSELSRTGDLWGQSSAQETVGDDQVLEAVAEVEFPLLAGKPMFEDLKLNASARAFQYDSVPGTDHVWKLGMNWQINSALRLRSTKGTSFRAPGLYELYLGNQTAFASQLAIDPCIQWGETNNDFIRQNCAAAGIPSDYPGAASSALIVSGGGAGVLVPETSDAFTLGLVVTPPIGNFSIAVDYFDIEVRDEISQLDSGSILFGCYGAAVYPNAFCDLFDRNPGNHPTDPFKIEEVRNQYININSQRTRGYDLNVNYDDTFSFGKLGVEAQFTYTLEDLVSLFDSAEASGFSTEDQVGFIGRPQLVGRITTMLEKNDWSLLWSMDYVHGTKNRDLDEFFTYFGFENAWRDIRAERRMYHTVSARYSHDNWSLLFGIQNLFNAEPPQVSGGVATRYGNVSAFATQYDYYGRTPFVRLSYKF